MVDFAKRIRVRDGFLTDKPDKMRTNKTQASLAYAAAITGSNSGD